MSSYHITTQVALGDELKSTGSTLRLKALRLVKLTMSHNKTAKLTVYFVLG